MKAFSVAVISAIAASAAAAPLTESQYQYLFTTFADKYDKAYEVDTFMAKYNTFKENISYILEHNASQSSYTLGMNEFGDMTNEEFRRHMNLDLAAQHELFGSHDKLASPIQDSEDFSLQNLGLSNKDWSTTINNPVKNQGSCGSCWSFSTIGSMEYRHARSKGLKTAQRFSEQQLVDCDKSNSGCSGGLMGRALNYVMSAGGVCQASKYAYTGKAGFCAVNSCLDRSTKPKSIKKVTGGEPGLVSEIANGPVTVAVAASGTSFQFYKSGILNDTRCGNKLDHAVLAVGYGNAGMDYVKIRNSWGAGWGEGGYIRVAYNKNICGLGTSVQNGYDYVPVY